MGKSLCLSFISSTKIFYRIDASEFQRELISTIKNNDNFQKCVLASGKIGQHLQKELVCKQQT